MELVARFRQLFLFDFLIFEFFLIPLGRRVGYVMDGSLGE